MTPEEKKAKQRERDIRAYAKKVAAKIAADPGYEARRQERLRIRAMSPEERAERHRELDRASHVRKRERMAADPEYRAHIREIDNAYAERKRMLRKMRAEKRTPEEIEAYRQKERERSAQKYARMRAGQKIAPARISEEERREQHRAASAARWALYRQSPEYQAKLVAEQEKLERKRKREEEKAQKEAAQEERAKRLAEKARQKAAKPKAEKRQPPERRLDARIKKTIPARQPVIRSQAQLVAPEVHADLTPEMRAEMRRRWRQMSHGQPPGNRMLSQFAARRIFK